MTAPALYETGSGRDGIMCPVEQLWTPYGQDAEDSGFVAHRGLYVTGIDDPTEDHLFPTGFLVLGHQRWADIIEAAAAYMSQVHSWRNIYLYPGDDPSVLIPRIPRAVHTHGVFLRHPHPDHACGCGWDEAWRMVWAPGTEPGAVPVTALRHPAAAVTAASLPSPDTGAPATWAP
ncbi:hypothetical protein GCM10018785_26970 [Streptomyces longispororuber]|uniref:Uncharacterized protein n=1 Tax=Streptomyces longispororuber TaxID=68230 RepID=A0A918ZKJ0_9ACTN|nr:hypothetical protein [Streptomyces longispororuber]GHE56284.1 hypothetical protein GCM10018785_26970 [Streptomyces longispororuber]